MAEHSSIEWTDATWNPITGCAVVSAGCTNCYAMRLAGTRLQHHPSRAGLTRDTKAGPVWTGEVRLNEEWLTQPLRWKRPRKVFVCAHGDLFAEGVPDEWIDRVFAVMALAPQHTFQVLTKRPARMRAYIARLESQREGFAVFPPAKNAAARLYLAAQTLNWFVDHPGDGAYLLNRWPGWPLPNVWKGTSIEDQRRADERVPELQATPAAVRFVSIEPFLGPIDFSRIPVPASEGRPHNALYGHEIAGAVGQCIDWVPPLDWVIVGGESGPGARPMHPAWARSVRDACERAGVAFHFKQHGAWAPRGPISRGYPPVEGVPVRKITTTGEDGSRLESGGDEPVWMQLVGKKRAGRLLDGVTHDAFPSL